MHEQAKSLVKMNQKDRALLVLKLKKHKETAVDSIEKQLLQVFELIDTIEWESTNIQVSKSSSLLFDVFFYRTVIIIQYLHSIF